MYIPSTITHHPLPSPPLPFLQVLSKGSREALVAMLKTVKGVDPKEEKKSKVKVEADAVINFRQLAVGADEQGEVRGSPSSLVHRTDITDFP